MRTEQEMISQILHVANADDRVRAVLLTGSRTDPNAARDIFQDFDVIYIVTHLEEFIKDRNWIDIFGERLILQMPEEMTIGQKDLHSFHYLVLFKDHVRIDLTLFPLNKLRNHFGRDGSSTTLLDKDRLFEKLSPPSHDYLIKRPTQKEFTDCCNEFWWVSTYVAKGLHRAQVTYAKHMWEIPVRGMFLKMIEWYVGVRTGFTVSFGIGGRNIEQYIDNGLYKKVLATYPDSRIENMWHSLFLLTDLFDDLAKKVAGSLNFEYNKEEASNVTGHLKFVQTLSKTK